MPSVSSSRRPVLPLRARAGCLLLTAAIVTASPARAADPDATSLTVFAAASLTAAFRALGGAYERAHPGAQVTFNFAGSPTLVQQIREGAPADVFAAADAANMRKLVDAGSVEGVPRLFAQNRLQIVVEKGNPHRISALADLVRPSLIVVLCGDTVPCGRYAHEAFARANLTPPAGSREPDVKAVLNKIALGEADAGIVYVTDVRAAADKVDGVDLPTAHDVPAGYPIAALRESPHRAAALAFIAFVLSEPGTKILGEYGFQSP